MLWTVALLMFGVLSGLGAQPEYSPSGSPSLNQSPRKVVAFAQDTLANDWRLAQARELEAAFDAHPEIEFVLSNANGSTALQIQHIEDFTDQRVDLLIVSPRDVAAMTPAISKANRSGIPVVLLTRRILSDDYTTFVGPDDQLIAAEAARFLARQLGGVGRVFVLQGVPTASTAVDRTRGFLQEIRNYPGIEVVALKPANYLRSDALLAMDSFLEQQAAGSADLAHDPGFDAVYAQSDSMAAGARLALEMAGNDSSNLVTVGIDYIAEARDAIRQGRQTASFVYPTSSREAAEAALAILAGRTVPRLIRVPSVLVTIDNVETEEPIF